MSLSETTVSSGSVQVTGTGVPLASSASMVQVRVWSTAVVICFGVEVTAEIFFSYFCQQCFKETFSVLVEWVQIVSRMFLGCSHCCTEDNTHVGHSFSKILTSLKSIIAVFNALILNYNLIMSDD